MTRIILATILFVIVNNCFSQITTFYVHPLETGISYIAVQDSHLVVRNTSINKDKLFLFIGGSGSNTRSYRAISNLAGELGYDVINLSYINDVTAASLKNSTDSFAFNNFRQEVCFGTPVSTAVSVDSINSILSRTIKLLQYLDITFPSQNWSQYLLNNTTLDWSKIAVGGHSQGAGHACYFAKKYTVDRVLMFSGSNDYSDYFSTSANWLRNEGATVLSRHFSYLNLLDELIPFSKQIINLQGLELHPLYDTLLIDNINEPYNETRCLYTKQSPGIAILYHNATVKKSTINDEVWTYMLTSEFSTGINFILHENQIKIYPNPTDSWINLTLDYTLLNKAFTIKNLVGQTIMIGKSGNYKNTKIDITKLKKGIYFLTINRKTVQIVKQ